MATRDPTQLGGPCSRFFTAKGTLSKFETVLNYLNRNHSDAVQNETLSAAKLAELTASMIRFQDEHLGARKAMSGQTTLVRVPANLFVDLSKGGGLCIILGALFEFKSSSNLRKIDFASSSRMDKHMELMLFVTQALIDAKKIVRPKIFFSPGVDAKLKDYLTKIARKYECNIVSAKSDAKYVILPPVQTDMNEEYMRPVELNQGSMRVHWWYFPDSYDTWLSEEESAKIEDKPDSAAAEKVWEVHAQWVTDMARFNEYMNPEDYLVDGDEALSTDKFIEQAEALRKKATPTSAPNSASKTTPASNGSGKKSKPQPSPSSSKKSSETSLTLKLLKTATKSSTSTPPSSDSFADQKKRKREDDNLDSTQEPLKKRERPPEAPLANVPAPPVEPKVEQVFDDEATSLNSKRRHIDVNLKPPRKAQIQEIVGDGSDDENDEDSNKPRRTVEEQGLKIIVPASAAWFDYDTLDEIEIKALPEFFSGGNQSKAPEIYMAYRNFMIDTYRLNPTEYLTATACRRNLLGDVCSILRVHAFLEQWGLINYQVDYEMRPSPMGPPSAEHFMLLADTPAGLRPFNTSADTEKDLTPDQKVAKVERSETNAAAKRPSFGISTDFYRTPEYAHDEVSWTNQETLALLEGIDMYRDDWIKVAEHVNECVHDSESVRSHDDCIAAFLRLPIEDPYLDPDNAVGAHEQEDYPFSDTSNPLMTTLKFLMSVQMPDKDIKLPLSVAAAGAKGALTQLSKEKADLVSPKRKVTGSTEEASNAMETDPVPTSAKREAEATDAEKQDALRRTTEAVLASAADKAKMVARAQELKLKGLITLLIETQLEKIDIKLRHFAQTEALLDKEWEKLAVERAKVLKERMKVQQSWQELEVRGQA